MLTLAFKLATTDITLINHLVNLVSFSHVCQAIQASIFCPQNKHACGISMIIYSLHFTILFITWWKSLQPFGWCMIYRLCNKKQNRTKPTSFISCNEQLLNFPKSLYLEGFSVFTVTFDFKLTRETYKPKTRIIRQHSAELWIRQLNNK